MIKTNKHAGATPSSQGARPVHDALEVNFDSDGMPALVDSLVEYRNKMHELFARIQNFTASPVGGIGDSAQPPPLDSSA